MLFPLRDIRKKSSQHVRACVAGDGAICSKNRQIVPYHGANPNTRNGARLRSTSPIMTSGFGNDLTDFAVKLITFLIPNNLNPARATNTFRTKCNIFHILNDRGNPSGVLPYMSYIGMCWVYKSERLGLE